MHSYMCDMPPICHRYATDMPPIWRAIWGTPCLHAVPPPPQALFLLMRLCDGPNVYEVLEEHGPFEEAAALQCPHY